MNLSEQHPGLMLPVRAILLTGTRDKYVIVDPEDYATARRYEYRVNVVRHNVSRQEYVTAYTGPGPGRCKSIEQVITGWAMTGHANGDPFDCRRVNLIQLDKTLQQFSRRPRPGSASRFKGVSRAPRSQGRWLAGVGWKGTYYRLGVFGSEEDAARAYDKKVIELAGPVAAPYVMTNERLGLFEDAK